MTVRAAIVRGFAGAGRSTYVGLFGLTAVIALIVSLYFVAPPEIIGHQNGSNSTVSEHHDMDAHDAAGCDPGIVCTTPVLVSAVIEISPFDYQQQTTLADAAPPVLVASLAVDVPPPRLVT